MNIVLDPINNDYDVSIGTIDFVRGLTDFIIQNNIFSVLILANCKLEEKGAGMASNLGAMCLRFVD